MEEPEVNKQRLLEMKQLLQLSEIPHTLPFLSNKHTPQKLDLPLMKYRIM